MKFDFKRSYGVTATIVEFNNLEMRQVAEMANRIECVLNSHKDEKVKNEYLSDDELERCRVILSVISKEYKNTEVSAFDEELAKRNAPKDAEKPQPKDATPEGLE